MFFWRSSPLLSHPLAVGFSVCLCFRFTMTTQQVQHIIHGIGRQGEGDILNGSNNRGQSDAVRESIQRKAFLRELEAMIRLRNPHIVNVHGAITSLPDRLVLVLELLSGGDLRNMLKNSEKPLPEEQCRQMIRDICTGMAFLHSKKTVHGDLKSANILLDGHGRAKVRWACVLVHHCTTCFTPFCVPVVFFKGFSACVPRVPIATGLVCISVLTAALISPR